MSRKKGGQAGRAGRPPEHIKQVEASLKQLKTEVIDQFLDSDT